MSSRDSLRSFLLAALVMLSAPVLVQGQEAVPAERLAAREAFREARFGMFIHWGVYSMLGQGEWVMNNRDIQVPAYEALASSFNPIRFDARETSKDEAVRGELADELAGLADAFVSDGFGVVHRKQASVYDVALRLPHAAGNLVLAEVSALRKAVEDPERPYVVVLGGSKVSDKLGVIANLLTKADKLLIGGGMVFTFLKAQGHEVGSSLLEEDQVETVKGYLAKAAASGVEIVLPVDIVAADGFAADAAHVTVDASAIPADKMGLDIGPRSGELFRSEILAAKTIAWNGPMGVFEFPAFAEGTRAVAQALVDTDGFSIVGGGDSAAAVRRLGFDEAGFGHISTGGGASLELLEGKILPGIAVLED